MLWLGCVGVRSDQSEDVCITVIVPPSRVLSFNGVTFQFPCFPLCHSVFFTNFSLCCNVSLVSFLVSFLFSRSYSVFFFFSTFSLFLIVELPIFLHIFYLGLL